MNWIPRSYLTASVAQSQETRYVWDEGNLAWVYTVAESVDRQTLPWANWIHAAICGLTIATAEWVVFRLQPFHKDRSPELAIEAAWCANIDPRYCYSLEFSRREWTGPIRGPLLTCMNLMQECLFESPDAGTKPLHCPLLAAQLVEHVCGESRDAFNVWRDQIIRRLHRFYQAPEPLSDLYGELESKMVVPPQAFDPAVDFDIKDAPALADAFLQSVDYQSNPRLVPPDRMRSNGFEGIPYHYPS